jgi:hypothetical protein
MIMTNANRQFESHEFNEVSEAFSNPTHHANGNGKTSTTPVQQDLEADDDLTPEEEQQLAGFNPATPQLISEEYRLKQDQEGAVERPLAERASIRLGSVVAVVGTVMGAGAVLWFGFLQPRPPARQVTQSPAPTPSPPTFDETAELKSRLAFQDQQQQLQPESAARHQSPAPSRPVASRSTAPAPTPVAVSPPITASRPDPVIIRSPVTPPERIQPVERVDPFQRWAQLANVGQLRVSPGAMEPSRTASSDLPGAQSNSSASATQQNPVIPVVSIGRTETESSSLTSSSDTVPNPFGVASSTELRSTFSADMTPGMIGILNRTPAGQLDGQMGGFREVALGTFTKARVIMPMIWDEGSNNSTGGAVSAQENRFAVELVEDMKATNGRVALPAGTVLVIRTSAVGRGNNLVSASAIAAI